MPRPDHAPLQPPLTPEQLLERLAALGLDPVTERHEAAFTVEQSRHLTGHIKGAHTKNLFVKDKKGRLFLVVAEHERRIDLKRLHEAIGASGRLSFATAEQMWTHLGVTPGAVTALAVVNDREHVVSVIVDEGLMAGEIVNCHPLVNTMTTSLTPRALLAFFEATGHKPRIMALPEPPAEG